MLCTYGIFREQKESILKKILSFVSKKLIKNSFETRKNKLTGDSLSVMLSIPTSQFEVRKKNKTVTSHFDVKCIKSSCID